MLELNGIVASYGSLRALFDLSLRVDEGSVVAVVGRNGAGKTTTLRVASGMLAPDAGEVWLNGTQVNGRPAEDFAMLGCAHVPEGRRVFPRFSVRENLAVGAYGRRLRRKELSQEIDRVGSMFPKLVERMDQEAGTLSGGEQQMLAIARALMSRPRLLLIDEPSLGLAPIVVDQLYQAMERLRNDGMTILLVEQYVDRALGISDAAYLIEKGHVARHGRSSDLARDGDLAHAYLSGEGG